MNDKDLLSKNGLITFNKFVNAFHGEEKKEFMKHRNFDDDEYEPIANIEKMMLDDRRPPYEVILNIIFSEQNIKTKSLYNDLYNPLLSFNIDFTSLLDKNHNQEYEFLMDLKKEFSCIDINEDKNLTEDLLYIIIFGKFNQSKQSV
nr:6606_t:CDS:2 [Entrophospora candida]